MADQDPLQLLSEARAAVAQQAEAVRTLKDAKASPDNIASAVAELKALKAKVAELSIHEKTFADNFDRDTFETMLQRRFFYTRSFEIYGGVSGFYDFGPPGCALKQHFLSQWRRYFVAAESMLEVDSSVVTPYKVFEASGHVKKFTDFLTRDVVTLDPHRADHVVEAHLEALLADTKASLSTEARKAIASQLAQVEGMDGDELAKAIIEHNIKAPITGNELTTPAPFNLMFATDIGPSGDNPAFLRPETAQNIFVNFKRLYESTGQRLPFSACTIGQVFRNEISPRAGLLRVREFTLAEIEHFMDPEDDSHPGLPAVLDTKVNLFSRESQLSGKPPVIMTIKEAMDSKIITNRTLAYFMARINTFLLNMGAKTEFLRFRQHLSNEMAHYANDCWDAELETSYGWVECVGLADRSANDLKWHAAASKVDLSAQATLKEPIIKTALTVIPSKKTTGKAFRRDAKRVVGHLASLEGEAAASLKASLDSEGTATVVVEGDSFTVLPEHVEIKEVTTKQFTRKFLPQVVEPSFGVGRILYALLEHAFYVREEEEDKRTVLGLAPTIAPVQCSVLPISTDAVLGPIASSLRDALAMDGILCKLDASGAPLGRRYARTDEIGIPFGITVDFDTPVNKKVTLRERDTRSQLHVPIEDIPSTIRKLCSGVWKWADAEEAFPKFEGQTKSS